MHRYAMGVSFLLAAAVGSHEHQPEGLPLPGAWGDGGERSITGCVDPAHDPTLVAPATGNGAAQSAVVRARSQLLICDAGDPAGALGLDPNAAPAAVAIPDGPFEVPYAAVPLPSGDLYDIGPVAVTATPGGFVLTYELPRELLSLSPEGLTLVYAIWTVLPSGFAFAGVTAVPIAWHPSDIVQDTFLDTADIVMAAEQAVTGSISVETLVQVIRDVTAANP